MVVLILRRTMSDDSDSDERSTTAANDDSDASEVIVTAASRNAAKRARAERVRDEDVGQDFESGKWSVSELAVLENATRRAAEARGVTPEVLLSREYNKHAATMVRVPPSLRTSKTHSPTRARQRVIAKCDAVCGQSASPLARPATPNHLDCGRMARVELARARRRRRRLVAPPPRLIVPLHQV